MSASNCSPLSPLCVSFLILKETVTEPLSCAFSPVLSTGRVERYVSYRPHLDKLPDAPCNYNARISCPKLTSHPETAFPAQRSCCRPCSLCCTPPGMSSSPPLWWCCCRSLRGVPASSVVGPDVGRVRSRSSGSEVSGCTRENTHPVRRSQKPGEVLISVSRESAANDRGTFVQSRAPYPIFANSPCGKERKRRHP